MTTYNKGTLENQVDDDFDLDNIEDLPAFATPPDGAYLITLVKGLEEKEINDDKYYEAAMTIQEVQEMSGKLEEGEQPPKPGDVATIIFKRDNVFGMGNFKIFVKSIAERFSVTKIGDIREKSKGIEMLVIIKRKWNKKDERWNISVTKAQIV
jgi:hypothetical protein